MEQTVRLMVVSMHKLFRECVASMLSSVEMFEIIDHRVVIPEILERASQWRPDVVLIDLGQPRDGTSRRELELVRKITQDEDGAKVIIMGVSELDPDILVCIEEGASGYVSKESSLEELKHSINLVLGGNAICPPRLAFSMFSRLNELSRECERGERVEALKLTPRELEILQLIAEGYSNKMIAEHLCLSIYTVKNHVHHILEKLQVQGRAEAVAYALQRRWFRDTRFRSKRRRTRKDRRR